MDKTESENWQHIAEQHMYADIKSLIVDWHYYRDYSTEVMAKRMDVNEIVLIQLMLSLRLPQRPSS